MNKLVVLVLLAAGPAFARHFGGFDVYTASVSLVDKNNQILWMGITTKRVQRACGDAIAKQLKDAIKHKR